MIKDYTRKYKDFVLKALLEIRRSLSDEMIMDTRKPLNKHVDVVSRIFNDCVSHYLDIDKK